MFEANVRTCREGCQPAYCTSGTGRSEPSFGRKRRSVNDTQEEETNTTVVISTLENNNTRAVDDKEQELPEFVREMIEVFESREELQQEARRANPFTETVCLTAGEYHGMLSALMVLIITLISFAIGSGIAYRRYWRISQKNLLADRSSPNSSYPTTTASRSSGISIFGGVMHKPFPSFGRAKNPFPDLDCPAPTGMFEDPSEPIYTDPSLFERSRSLRSISVSPKRSTSNN